MGNVEHNGTAVVVAVFVSKSGCEVAAYCSTSTPYFTYEPELKTTKFQFNRTYKLRAPHARFTKPLHFGSA